MLRRFRYRAHRTATLRCALYDGDMNPCTSKARLPCMMIHINLITNTRSLPCLMIHINLDTDTRRLPCAAIHIFRQRRGRRRESQKTNSAAAERKKEFQRNRAFSPIRFKKE